MTPRSIAIVFAGAAIGIGISLAALVNVLLPSDAARLRPFPIAKVAPEVCQDDGRVVQANQYGSTILYVTCGDGLQKTYSISER